MIKKLAVKIIIDQSDFMTNSNMIGRLFSIIWGCCYPGYYISQSKDQWSTLNTKFSKNQAPLKLHLVISHLTPTPKNFSKITFNGNSNLDD
jgi:hypothetical protein